MRVAVIGRTEVLYETALRIIDYGYNVPLIITAKEAPEYLKTSEDFRKLAEKIGAYFIKTSKINHPSVIADLRKLQPIDIAVSVNYPNIIEKSVIDIFRICILNAHAGDLPRFRGNACMAWAILNGENKIGLCVHKMVGGELDAGDIIQREYLDIDINTKIGTCWKWFSDRVPDMMLKAINLLKDDPNYVLEKQSKNPKHILRCYPRFPEDGKIDWTKSNIEILRLINASSEPYSGAFCEYEGNKMTIWDAQLYDDKENFLAVPGQVAKIESDGSIIVICGKGKLKIHEITWNGTRTKPGSVIRSIRNRLK